MTKQELNEFMMKKCYKKMDFYCPSSFQSYNGKRYVNLKTFWKLLNKQGIKTYEDGREWFDKVLDYISERSLKQRLGYFVKYGTLNCPIYFRQAIEKFNTYSVNPCCFIEPIDGNKDFYFDDYKYFDVSGHNITKDILAFVEEQTQGD